jgi:hypothetical protein
VPQVVVNISQCHPATAPKEKESGLSDLLGLLHVESGEVPVKLPTRLGHRWRLLLPLVLGIAGWWLVAKWLEAEPLYTLRYSDHGTIAGFDGRELTFDFTVATEGRRLVLQRPNIPHEGEFTLEFVDLRTGQLVESIVASSAENVDKELQRVLSWGTNREKILLDTRVTKSPLAWTVTKRSLLPFHSQPFGGHRVFFKSDSTGQALVGCYSSRSFGETVDRLIERIPVLGDWLLTPGGEVAIWDDTQRKLLWSVRALTGEGVYTSVQKTKEDDYVIIVQHRRSGNEVFVFPAPLNLVSWSAWWARSLGLLISVTSYLSIRWLHRRRNNSTSRMTETQ